MKRVLTGLLLVMMVLSLFGCSAPTKQNGKFDVNALNCYMELHAHLDGSISLESAKELAKLQNIEIPSDDEEVLKKLRVDEDCADLNEFLEKFDFPGTLLQTREGLKKATENLLCELKEDGVIYAEIRFAPQLHTQNGLTMKDAVEAVLAGMENAEIETNCILCCMRGEGIEEQNLETVRIAAEYLDKGVCAIDLAGAEALYPTKDFKPVYDLAKELGVPFTVHAGEADGPESVKTAVEFGTKRIGHGVRAAESDEVMKLLKDNGVTLELCPSSNLRTKVFDKIGDYPLKTLQKQGIKVTVNTDDMSVIGTDIKKEFSLLVDTFKLTKDDVHELLCNSVEASFAGAALKEKLKHMIDYDMGYTKEAYVEKRKIIIDADMAADDATAILIACAEPGVEILGVTVAAGNVSLEQAAQNALMTLEIAGKSDVPVYEGASKPISGMERPTFSVFGEDGMGDADLIHPKAKSSDQTAVDFILNTLRENPREVEIVCLAPATNLAECIQQDAETMHLVKRVWTMGTSGLGIGNATPVAEFNVYKDAEAYEIFLKEELPTTVIGLDMNTEETFLKEAEFAEMKKSGKANQFIEKTFRSLAEYKKKDFGYAFGDCPDGIAMACALWPDFVKSSIKTHAVCITDNETCYGQVVFYRKGISYDSMISFDSYNTELVSAVDKPNFAKRTIEALKTIK